MPHSGSFGRHLCWAFGDPADFARPAAEQLRGWLDAARPLRRA